MQKIIDILNKKFTYSVEIVPPRNGAGVNVIFEKLNFLKKLGIDFLSVTKGAGGSLRGGTLPISYFANIKYGLTTLAHFTCREINQYEVENHLVDLDYFGIKNVLALRGDPPDLSDEEQLKGQYDHAYQLVQHITRLNNGKFLARTGFDKEEYNEGIKADFCIGVAAHPEEPSGKRVEYLKKKVEEGAEFAITQMVFDVDIYIDFIKELKKAGIKIPVIPGVWPLDIKWKLEQTEEKFKVSIPRDVKEKLFKTKGKDEFKKEGIKFTIELCKKLKKAGAPGIHLFVFQDVELAKEIIDAVRNSE